MTAEDKDPLYENQQRIADNQVIIDEKITRLEKALQDALTPPEKKQQALKEKQATVADIEEALKKQKEAERHEKAQEQVLQQLQDLATQKLDTLEENLESLFEKNELEYDEDAKEDFDTWTKKFMAMGMKEQEEEKSKNFDWKKFNQRMENKFKKSYRLKNEESDNEDEESEDEKPRGKAKSPKSLTGLNDGVEADVKNATRFDKLMDKLDSHNRVIRGQGKPGDSKMSELELVRAHREINQARNKQRRLQEV